MCGIMITHSRLRALLDYNPNTGISYWKIPVGSGISERAAGQPAGGPRTKQIKNDYILLCVDGKRYYAHRLAWFYVYKTWPVDQIDHKDNNKQNNAICNLREATDVENSGNLKARKNSKTGIKGIYPRNKGKYRYTVQVKGKHCGHFVSLLDAVLAHRDASIAAFGEFANWKG
jgi:hypothetical protein